MRSPRISLRFTACFAPAILWTSACGAHPVVVSFESTNSDTDIVLLLSLTADDVKSIYARSAETFRALINIDCTVSPSTANNCQSLGKFARATPLRKALFVKVVGISQYDSSSKLALLKLIDESFKMPAGGCLRVYTSTLQTMYKVFSSRSVLRLGAHPNLAAAFKAIELSSTPIEMRSIERLAWAELVAYGGIVPGGSSQVIATAIFIFGLKDKASRERILSADPDMKILGYGKESFPGKLFLSSMQDVKKLSVFNPYEASHDDLLGKLVYAVLFAWVNERLGAGNKWCPHIAFAIALFIKFDTAPVGAKSDAFKCVAGAATEGRTDDQMKEMQASNLKAVWEIYQKASSEAGLIEPHSA